MGLGGDGLGRRWFGGCEHLQLASWPIFDEELESSRVFCSPVRRHGLDFALHRVGGTPQCAWVSVPRCFVYTDMVPIVCDIFPSERLLWHYDSRGRSTTYAEDSAL